MSDATTSRQSNTSAGQTIRPDEAAHFGKLAKDWWDPEGSSAMLHKLNPVRLEFLREAIDLHWAGDIRSAKPLAGKSALDVGCGAGLLCEPLSRLGADVTGVDAAAENVSVARTHAEAVDLGALASSVVEEFEDLGQHVTITNPPRLVARVQVTWIKRALRNLIGNAVRYGGSAAVA